MKPFARLSALVDPNRPVSLAAMGRLAVATLVLDQLTKIAAVAGLRDQPPIILIPGLLNLAYAQNTGAAFSMFHNRTGILTLISIAISIAIAVWAVRLPAREQGLRWALGLVLGGAVGNLIDRARLGYVIDFIDAHWFWKAHWPTFNIADSAVCTGMALLVIATFRAPATAPEPQSAGDGKSGPGGGKRP
jgi:signal peptidase II